MSKILLVEDDNNLREIYEARLEAEGYETVSAPDGEAALAMAANEHPDLIITDVMMPKVSGFEMLDILRNTQALQDVKVIMLTALGQAEDNARANSLGADRYLVKSQVTLEDIIKAAHDVLEGPAAAAEAAAADPGAVTAPAAQMGEIPEPAIVSASEPAAEPASQAASVPAYEPAVEPAVEEPVAQEPAAEPLSFEPLPSEPVSAAATDDDSATSDDLTLPEPVIDVADAQATADAAPTASQEESDIRAQIDQFIDSTDTTPAIDLPQDPAPAADPAAPAEEPESEFAKDDATPDMGQMSVHIEEPEQPAPAVAEQPAEAPAAPAIEQPAAAEAQPTAVATPGYPSQPFEMPTADPSTLAAAPIETTGDQAITDAVTNMTANSPGAGQAPEPLLAPSEKAAQEEAERAAEAAAAAMPAVAAPALETAPETAIETPPQPQELPEPVAPADPEDQPAQQQPAGSAPATPVSHKRVIAPLPTQSKPDIHQLLAAEDAKVAASQAAAANTMAAPTGVVAEPAQQQPAAAQSATGFDPNAVSL